LAPFIVVTPVHFTGRKLGFGTAFNVMVVPAAAITVFEALLNMVGVPLPTVTVTVHQLNVLLIVSVGRDPLPLRSCTTEFDKSGDGEGLVVVSQLARMRSDVKHSAKRIVAL
jgi:hypothetical protein